MIRINDKIVELLNENGELVLEQQYHADEFIWVVRSKEPIILQREGNETFFDEYPLRDYAFVDGCHPNDIGNWCMANVIGKKVSELLK